MHLDFLSRSSVSQSKDECQQVSYIFLNKWNVSVNFKVIFAGEYNILLVTILIPKLCSGYHFKLDKMHLKRCRTMCPLACSCELSSVMCVVHHHCTCSVCIRQFAGWCGQSLGQRRGIPGRIWIEQINIPSFSVLSLLKLQFSFFLFEFHSHDIVLTLTAK